MFKGNTAKDFGFIPDQSDPRKMEKWLIDRADESPLKVSDPQAEFHFPTDTTVVQGDQNAS
ncbi:MAG TPA: hypothetical protein VF575_01925 [Candidatus Saccharimonadales bacterium]|jgi:hypothetical protein